MPPAATKPLKLLECRDLLPNTACTLFFIGNLEEVSTAFVDHAKRAYPETGDAAERADIDGNLQAAVFVEPNRAYVGDKVEQPDPDTIRIPGPGVVVQRFASSVVASLMCKCTQGLHGTCTVQLDGHTANCLNNTCTTCGWSTDIPSSSFTEPKIKPEFD